jgi:hypothetical protein
MRKRRLNQYGYYESVLAGLRFRFNTGDPVGGNAPAVEPDVEPANGGPDRDFSSLSNATIDEPVNQPANPAGTAPATQQRTPADPNQRAGAPAPVAAATGRGFQFDHTVTDDRTALEFLLRQAGAARQENVYAQLGRQLAPDAGRIQGFLAQSTQPQTATPARQPWEAPEFDERWAGLVEQDAGTGLYTAKQGVPHEIANKVNAYVEWKKGYDRDPAAVINGMVEARAKAISRDTFNEQFAAHQHQATVGAIVQENSAWMYQLDAGGQRARDYQGQYIPTPVGAAYIQQLRTVQQMGVTDPRQQDALAKQLVRGQYAQASQQQQWAAQQAANPQTTAAVGQPNINPLQAAPPSTRRANPAATEPNEVGLSLAERLRRDLAADGVTDLDVFNSSQ